MDIGLVFFLCVFVCVCFFMDLDFVLVHLCFFFMDVDLVLVHKNAKKGLGQYPTILTSCLVNNLLALLNIFLIINLLVAISCVDIHVLLNLEWCHTTARAMKKKKKKKKNKNKFQVIRRLSLGTCMLYMFSSSHTCYKCMTPTSFFISLLLFFTVLKSTMFL